MGTINAQITVFKMCRHRLNERKLMISVAYILRYSPNELGHSCLCPFYSVRARIQQHVQFRVPSRVHSHTHHQLKSVTFRRFFQHAPNNYGLRVEKHEGFKEYKANKG